MAISTRLGEGSFQDPVLSVLGSAAPGATGEILRSAVRQGSDAASANLLVIGAAVAAVLVSGTAGILRLERGANRIYGIENGRPLRSRYTRAFLLTLS